MVTRASAASSPREGREPELEPHHDITYAPINTLKGIADGVWIVDGPVIEFGPLGLKMPFPTRMTIIRLADGSLFLHSPTPVTPSLQREIEAIGRPRWIIGPNRIHYWWIPDWRQAYPEADVYLAPRIREQSSGRIDFPASTLDRDHGYPWDGPIATLPIHGAYMTEVEFFHHPSRTLILTDLIENFEIPKLPTRWLRWLVRLGGVAHPHGGMPFDMRLTVWRQRRQLRDAIRQMIAWQPERVVLAHGKWFDTDGAAELRRAFRWVL